MGRGSKYHGRGVNIPWIGVEYNMDKGFNILYIF
jgi:hypothetical protein